ncbi:MAG: aspartate kinase [Lachnospiraceae bacterium]|nr:aspartate kinase [Candidatus Darwinimomas equi]
MKTVVKFGGSSVANAGQFKKVAEIIKSDKSRRYIVVSAPGKSSPKDEKVTDLLYRLYDEITEGKSYKKTLAAIRKKYTSIADDLDLKFNVDYELDKIESDIKEGAGRDYAASRGEYLCAHMMAEYLGFEFVDAADLIFFGSDGNVAYEKTYEEIEKTLETVKKAVIPGFYGSLLDGGIKTFTRGGSDVTGSLIAKGITADMYENWTDVSGFMVADPRIIKNPKVIESITYAELRELSYMGASVLHEDAFFPVRKEGIPIHIRNTNDPEAPGTLIVESTCKNSKYTITGIAGKKGFCSVNIDEPMMNSVVGFCMNVLKVFSDNGLSIEHMPSGIDTMSVFIHQSEFEEKEQQIISGIHRAVHPDSVVVDTGIALIAVVGRGMKSVQGTAGRIFSALAHAGVNIKMIDQGSSELNIIIGVKDSDFEVAIKAIYDIFVDTEE